MGASCSHGSLIVDYCCETGLGIDGHINSEQQSNLLKLACSYPGDIGPNIPEGLRSASKKVTPFVPKRVAWAFASGYYNNDSTGAPRIPPSRPRSFLGAVLLVLYFHRSRALRTIIFP
jgi:hypothetical protein